VRVGENSSVSVDVIAGFDVLSINSVPNQTHSSFILCYTHSPVNQHRLHYTTSLQQIKQEKVPLLPDWIGLDSIGIGPTHTLLFIFSRMYSENIGFHSQGERRLTSVYTYMHEPFYLVGNRCERKKNSTRSFSILVIIFILIIIISVIDNEIKTI
jgi:hypothetical protein